MFAKVKSYKYITSLFPLLQGPLWPELVVLFTIASISQVESSANYYHKVEILDII